MKLRTFVITIITLLLIIGGLFLTRDLYFESDVKFENAKTFEPEELDIDEDDAAAIDEDVQKTITIRKYPSAPDPEISEPIGGGSDVRRRFNIAPAPPPAAIVEDQSDTIARQLFSAAMAFVIPDSANIDDSIKAQLLINPSEEVIELEKELSRKGIVTSGEITVSKIVKATIIAPDFEVVNITEEEQVLLDNQSTEWLWSLSPKTAGDHDVSLTVTAIVTVGDRETKHQLKTFEKTVVINITTGQIISNWFTTNWEWILSTLVIPFGIWVYNKRLLQKLKKKLFN